MVCRIVFIRLIRSGLTLCLFSWELFCLEHGLDASGHMISPTSTDPGISTFFHEASSGKFVPRSVMVDLEPTTVDCVRQGPNQKLFHPEGLISGKEGTTGKNK
jgi:tubulin alpha